MSGWGKDNVLNYYTNNRSLIGDLYKSEILLLKKKRLTLTTMSLYAWQPLFTSFDI